MIKAVLFDYGGVIKDGHRLASDIGKICNISEEEVVQTREKRMIVGDKAAKGFISDKEYWEGFQKILGKPIPNNCVDLAQKIYRDTFVFIPGMLDLVKKLKAQGIKTAVLSDIFKFEAEVIRENNGYDEFDPVILSYEVGMKKPDLEIYLLAIEKLKAKPEEIIFIDDREQNLLPAKELGIKTVLAENPEQITKDVFSIINSQSE